MTGASTKTLSFTDFRILNTTGGGHWRVAPPIFYTFFSKKNSQKFAGFKKMRTFASAFDKNA